MVPRISLLCFLVVFELCSLGATMSTNSYTLQELLSATPDSVIELGQKPKGDPRSYQYSKLGNGLQVVNIWDPNSTQAAMSVSVSVGSFSDPTGVDGLAHLTEHAMFLGSGKYADRTGFDEFLAQNGGSSNAYTAEEKTVYYASLDKTAFAECMERFGDVFANPLFNDTWVWGEVSAVDSEHSKNKKTTGWRVHGLLMSLADPASPVHRFHTGNSQTLKKETKEQLTKHITDFFDTNYCPVRMRLVTFGPLNLSAQLKQAEKTFGSIPTKGRSGQCADQPPAYGSPIAWPPSSLRQFVRAQGLSTTPQLHALFPMQNLQPWTRNHPVLYLRNLLGDGARRSLLSTLRDELGLVTSIGADAEDTSAGTVVQISMTLLPEGAKQPATVLDAMFMYLDKARASLQASKEVLLRSWSNASRLVYDWSDLEAPEDTVSGIAEQMLRLNASDLLAADSLLLEPSVDKANYVLDKVRPENMIVLLLDAAGESQWNNGTNSSRENVRSLAHYGMEFTTLSFDSAYPNWWQWLQSSPHANATTATDIAKLPASLSTRLQQIEPGMERSEMSLRLPSEIEDLPQITSLNQTATAAAGSDEIGKLWGQTPTIIASSSGDGGADALSPLVELWHREGWMLPQPRVVAATALRRPGGGDPESGTPRDEIALAVGLRILDEQLSLRLPELRSVDTSWQIDADRDSFRLTLRGFDPTASSSFNRLLAELHNGLDPEVEHRQGERRLQRVVGDLRRQIEDKTQAVLEVAVAQRDILLQPGAHSKDEFLAAFDAGGALTFDQVAKAVNDSKQGNLSAVSLVMGSYSKQDSRQLGAQILGQLGVGSDRIQLFPTNSSERIKRVLKPARSVELRAKNPRADNTSVMLTTLLAGVNDVEQRVLLGMISSVLHQIAFAELRTRLQLGYTVGASVSAISNVLTVSCFVQTEVVSPDIAEAHCEKVLSVLVPDALEDLSDDQFQSMKEAFLNDLLQRPWSIKQEMDRFWSLTLLGDCLELHSEMLEFAKTLKSKAELIEAWRRVVVQPEARQKVVVKLFGSGLEPADQLSPEKAGELLQNVLWGYSATSSAHVDDIIRRTVSERRNTTMLQGLASSQMRAKLRSAPGAGYFSQETHCKRKAPVVRKKESRDDLFVVLEMDDHQAIVRKAAGSLHQADVHEHVRKAHPAHVTPLFMRTLFLWGKILALIVTVVVVLICCGLRHSDGAAGSLLDNRLIVKSRRFG
eukprot:TRINITY_DN41557_c0_g1_i1.p1 TRINITY_DN41557_c0_g1~~TRINITY_DN41557_c0_g1_i1.p1  ORF type:complete len:1220 (-),score=221.41 TRINITY_DN41557_c0_g1_i1:50-3709(-)